jgi:ribosomal protein S12 methylthiotransferase accessory factor
MSSEVLHSLEAVADRYGALVDPRVGVISGLEETPHIPGEPRLHMVRAQLARVDRLYPICGFSPIAGGTSLDLTTAKVRACGEAVERYCGFLYSPDPELYLRHAELPGRGIAPDEWPRCSPAEYALAGNPLTPPDPRHRYQWVLGWSLLQQEPIFVPAVQTYLNYLPPGPEEMVMFPHSTGLAAGDSLESATLSGLCEVLERDAFMLTWCKQLPAPPLTVPVAAWPEVTERQRRVASCELQLELHALLPEHAPAKILALIRDRSGGPAPISCGLGVAGEARRAVAKAIDEAVQSRRAQVVAILNAEMPIPDAPEAVRSLEDHVAFYRKPERLAAFQFLRRTRPVPADELPALAGETPAAALGCLVRQLGEQGYEVNRVAITTPDIAAAGFHVVRVIVPGLVPLAHGHSMRFLACPRWQAFPGVITPFPHPFG